MRAGPDTAGILPGAAAALLALGLLAGCAAPPPQVAEEPRIQLVWPAPPRTPRIKFLRSVVSEEDIAGDTTFSQSILDLLSGQKPPAKRVSEPMGVAVSDDGQRIYVSSFNRGAVFGFDFEAQRFVIIEPLARPAGVALDGAGQIYVVQQGRQLVSVHDRDGRQLRTISHPSLERPVGVAIDRDRGLLYVVDTGTQKSQEHNVKVFDLSGSLVRTIGEGKGEGPGQFYFPTYATVDRAGNLYVADTINARVQKFDPNGRYLMSFGERGTAVGMFERPKGVALDSFGNLYVADSSWSNIQIFNPKGQALLFFGGRGPLPGMLKNPTAIAIDASNRIYAADFINHRVNVYELVNTTAEDSFLESAASTDGRQG